MSMFRRKFRIGTAIAAGSSEPGDEDTPSQSIPERAPYSSRSQSDPGQNQKIHSLPHRKRGNSPSSSTIPEETLIPCQPTPPRCKTSASPDQLVSHRITVADIRRDADDPLGLVLVHGTSQSDVDIIFVHGLGGSSRKTWSWERNLDLFWPAWLRHEEGLSHFRIFSYGYNANFREVDTPLSILDFAKDLLVWLKTYEHGTGSSIGPRPIVFVAHSMGGLVVKKALILGKHDELYSGMLSNVHGIMFLSTPHRGSLHAKTLNNILAVTVGVSTKVYISELESSSTSIEDISEQFRAICTSWKLVSLYETLQTKLVTGVKRMIVGKSSSVLSYPQEISVPLNADHHTVCKFPDRLDQNYVLVVNLIKHLTEGLATQSKASFRPKKSSQDEMRTIESMLCIHVHGRESLDLHLSQAFDGSCEWLQRRQPFLRWLGGSDTASDASVLWLTGLPGAGKSVLAARTIENLKQNLPCQYHFFSESNASKRSATYCIRSIAFQLATTLPAFAAALLDLHRETRFSASTQSFDSLWNMVFENIVFKMDFGSTLHWVIDGIDEADQPSVLVRALLAIKSLTPIKILILSRPMRELTILVGARKDRVILENISQEHTMADIQGYVSAGVAEILPQDASLQQTIAMRIAQKSEGSFLWTRLVVESLRDRWHTDSHIEQVLSSMPKDMASLYERMMGAIKKQPPDLRDLAFRILTWACCSRVALSIEELRGALGIEWGDFTSLGETAVQVCGQFVRVHGGQIFLIHSTARSFLLSRSAKTAPYIDSKTGHHRLATVCLEYLCRPIWRQVLLRVGERLSSSGGRVDRLPSIFEEHPLLKYCVNSWFFHLASTGPNGPDLLPRVRIFFEKSVLNWVQAVALTGNLSLISTATMSLKSWIRTRRRHAIGTISTGPTGEQMFPDTAFLVAWITDLTRIVGRFGSNLVLSPTSIHRLITAFCPRRSIVYRTYYARQGNPLISIHGQAVEEWDDNLARLRIGKDDVASAVYASEIYFFTLISHGGTVIVWHANTCQETRRLCHGEWVTLMTADKLGKRLATAGRHTHKVWDTDSGSLICTVPRSVPGILKSLDFSRDETALIVGYDDCSLVSYDVSSTKPTTLFAAQGQGVMSNCPSLMVLSADQTKLAIGFRGKPLFVCDVHHNNKTGTQLPLLTIIRAEDRDRLATDVCNSPQVVLFHPDSCQLCILYHDNIILMHNAIEDTQTEYTFTGARDMALNQEGSHLLTADYMGTLSVWALPKFNLIYRLQSHEGVRDLMFSPDGHRIYDVRHSGCNVWAPEALMRADEVDETETASSGFDGPYVGEAVSEPVVKSDMRSPGGQVTALVCDHKGEFFCCGRDDGSVVIHETKTGERARKVTAHSTTAEITVLAWTRSRKFMASADDCGKVIAKRLKIKDGKWAVYPVFEAWVGDAVRQLVFDESEGRLLVSTESEDRVWDLKTKKDTSKRKRESRTGRWMVDWRDRERIIWVEPETVSVHSWADLGLVATYEDVSMPEILVPAQGHVPSISVTRATDSNEAVRAIVRPSTTATNTRQTFIIAETHSGRGSSRAASLSPRYDLVCLASDTSVRRKNLPRLGAEIRHLLGCQHDRLVFLDHQGWICTAVFGWDMDNQTTRGAEVGGGQAGGWVRHFFLPGDWIHDLSLSLLALSEDGALLCARTGEVAVVRYSKGL